jgi:hypothetical protein
MIIYIFIYKLFKCLFRLYTYHLLIFIKNLFNFDNKYLTTKIFFSESCHWLYFIPLIKTLIIN